MYYINNNAFSCVLKVVRLQSDIRNAVGKLFHTEGPETAKLLSVACVPPGPTHHVTVIQL